MYNFYLVDLPMSFIGFVRSVKTYELKVWGLVLLIELFIYLY